jgi:hypothetical protein
MNPGFDPGDLHHEVFPSKLAVLCHLRDHGI